MLSLLLGAIAGCHSGDQPHGRPATPVRVASATRIDAPIELSASGVVEPMQTVAVTTQVTGTLLDVLFREGEYVSAGQVLFRIDPRPLQAQVDQARATLARDEAQADAGRRDDLRYQALVARGYVTRSQADQVHATALAQQATVEADRAVLRSAEVSLGYATVRAPIAGRTGSLLVRRGNVVSPNSGPLVIINQLRPVLVRFPVTDQDFPAVQRAVATHPLDVIASPADSTQTVERGQLSFLDNAIDSLTGTVTGKATFPNYGNRLWPGELVFLTLRLGVQRNVLAIPSAAVLTNQQGGSYVYVVDAKDTARPRNVATGLAVGTLTVVTGGLADGERVVTDGQSRLNPGSRVALVGGGAGADTSGASLNPAGTVGMNGRAGGGMAAGEVSASSGVAGGGGTGAAPASGRAGGAGAGGVGAAGGGVNAPGSNVLRGNAGAGRATAGANGTLPMQPSAPSMGSVTSPNGSAGGTNGASPTGVGVAPTSGTINGSTPGAVNGTTNGGAAGARTTPPTTSPVTRPGVTTPTTGTPRPATSTTGTPGRP